MEETGNGHDRGPEPLKRHLIVTGATGELGSGVLRAALAQEDIDLVIATSYSRPIYTTSDKLVTLENLDLVSPAGTAQLTELLSDLGTAQIGLLHCAGSFPEPMALHRMDALEISSVFAANTLTFLGAAKATLPHMRAAEWGRLIAFTSHTQGAAYPFLGAFNLAKAALLSAVHTLAHENARFGIACNAIAVATLMTEVERRIKPQGRYEDWVSVDELSKYAIDLALSESSNVNGSELHYWKYSESFFSESVFERNSLDIKFKDPGFM
jgi:NAD(P)-dependent dehydrogenase (short-subunit alcohol dehydrogenase family)